jgi:putative transposase
MARKQRKIPGNHPLHICNRSAGQLTIFHSVADYLCFENCLKELLSHFPLRLYAFCIMPNHWHLLMEGDTGPEVIKGLHWLGTTHAVRLRRDTATIGRGAVYQNRFRGYPIQRNGAFYRVAHYIERNPVDANLCRSPGDWHWSSAKPMKSNDIILADWPVAKPKNWAETISRPLDEHTKNEIRNHEALQHPFGDTEWVASFEY